MSKNSPPFSIPASIGLRGHPMKPEAKNKSGDKDKAEAPSSVDTQSDCVKGIDGVMEWRSDEVMK